MRDSAFEPAQPTVPAGKPAKFVIKNRDLTVHTYTIEALGIDVNVLPGSEELTELSSLTAGTYVYSCTFGVGFSLPIHKPEVESEPSVPSDTGTLVVTES
jgi:plastocyanin